jgi:hypothetical protein
MDWELAYQIVLGLGLILVGAWSFDARRLRIRILRLMQMQDGPPTEEIILPTSFPIFEPPEDLPTKDEILARNAFHELVVEDLGPGKPLPSTPPPGFAISEKITRRRGYRNSW